MGSQKRRSRVRREMRDLILRLGMLGGGLLGLLWMINTMPSTASAASCDGEKVRVGECMSDTLAELLVPALAKFGVGLFAGAFLAIVLISVMPGLRRPST